MNDFRTILPPARASFSIGYADRLMLVGSCFTENMGKRLKESKFQALTNPFGIVYNPVSMASSLEYLLSEHCPFTEQDLFENAGLWHSWEHHGHFSRPDRKAALTGVLDAWQSFSKHLKVTNRLLLTFGTSDVFTLLKTGQVVANNHKMPGALFEQRRLSVSETVEKVQSVLEKIKERNPDLEVVLTVSPVRHLRSGLVENQRSKAVLVLACEEICRTLPYAHYFPAYELLIDDLRDYRFYDTDMVHPSALAEEYVWAFFKKTFFTETTEKVLGRVEKIRAAAQHRPFHPNTPQHQAFVQAQLADINQMEQEYPGLDFEEEKRKHGLRGEGREHGLHGEDGSARIGFR
ncbi:MAG: GSCFA domain-containing protein [Saprospiraceae bacterium]|nr:GSCFA domain-containing protein [Saprospiraceae bacterium]